MTEKSMLWAAPAGTGDGAAAYTEDETTRLFRRLAVGGVNEGVLRDPEGEFSGAGNELAVVGSASPVKVLAGDAIVRGYYYWSNADLDVTIPTPLLLTRVDYIVLRVDYANDTVRITRIEGTEGAGAPSLTQDSAYWDIPLAEVSITTGGVITVTDKREYAHYNTAVSTAMIDDDAVTDVKVGDRVPQFYRRQGGDATDWSVAGYTDYTPSKVRMQAGRANISISLNTYGYRSITFPVAFSAPPVVFVGPGTDFTNRLIWAIHSISATGCTISIYTPDSSIISTSAIEFSWLAIGPE